MSADVEQRIRERAYAIWLEEGCPDGRDREHWLLAEEEIIGAAQQEAAQQETAKPAAKAPRRSRTAGPQAPAKPRSRKAVPA